MKPTNDLNNKRKVNGVITKHIIALHELGYVNDYHLANGHTVKCLQDETTLSTSMATIKLMSLAYDSLASSFKCLHTVETPCGVKGIMLLNSIFMLGNACLLPNECSRFKIKSPMLRGLIILR